PSPSSSTPSLQKISLVGLEPSGHVQLPSGQPVHPPSRSPGRAPSRSVVDPSRRPFGPPPPPSRHRCEASMRTELPSESWTPLRPATQPERRTALIRRTRLIEAQHTPAGRARLLRALSWLAMFVLGANYPWVSCGHDFGPRPPAWAGAKRTDWGRVQSELEELRGLGLSVVRYWLLAGGVNYPVGRDPDEIAARVPFREPFAGRRTGARALRFELHAPPPALPQAFLDDFGRLLSACRAAGVRLLPSLVSFELFLPITPHPGGPASGGRGALVLGANQRAFFDAVLEPLLEVSEGQRDALFAFEVMNEPDWPALPAAGRGPFAPPDALARFLVQGARRIARRGLLSTIGFCNARPSWLPDEA